MEAQMKQLNFDSGKTGFVFELKDIDWTVNAKWSKDHDNQEMKRKLRKGNYNALNLYYQNSFDGGIATSPANVKKGSAEFYDDGCYAHRSTVPGGSATNFNEGKITSHEVGHWMNLYHTFAGGCTEPNDEVDDTPANAPGSNRGVALQKARILAPNYQAKIQFITI